MKLTFVYNADSSFFSLVKGAVHKLASPETYPCNLCRLTYPLTSMDKEWKEFIKSLPFESIFLHRNEFNNKYPQKKNAPLPAVFVEDVSGMRQLISSEEINNAKSILDLIELVTRSLNYATK